jgi:hypothetical protein
MNNVSRGSLSNDDGYLIRYKIRFNRRRIE